MRNPGSILLPPPRRIPFRFPACALLLAFLPTFSSSSSAGPSHARRHMAEGLRAYEKKEWEAAWTAFDKAAEVADAEGLSPAYARVNAALALARAGRYNDMEQRLRLAEQTDNTRLHAAAYFNQARARAEAAEIKLEENNVEGARQDVQQALESYRRSIRLDPGDRASKIGYELAHARWKEIENMLPPEPDPAPNGPPATGEEPGDRPKDEPDPAGDPTSDPEGESPPGNEEGDPDNDGRDAEGEPGERDAPDDGSNGFPGAMSPQGADRILDALQDEEQAHRRTVRRAPSPGPVKTDW